MHGNRVGSAVEHELAAIGLGLRFGHIGCRHIEREIHDLTVVRIGHVARGVFPALVLIAAVQHGGVVPAGLHRPDGIALRAEGLSGVLAHARVHNGRFAARIEDVIADVIVVVALGVAAALGREEQPVEAVFCRARRGDLNPAEPVAERGRIRLIGIEALVPVEKRAQRPLGVVGALDQVLIGTARAVMRQPHPAKLPERVVSGLFRHAHEHLFAAIADPHGRVGKVDKIVARDVDMANVVGHVADQRLVKEIDLSVRGLLVHFEDVHHGRAGHVEIARAFVAAAVLSIKIEEALRGAADLAGEVHAHLLVPAGDKRRGQHVFVDPGVPVVDRVVVTQPHPEIVHAGQIRNKDALFDFIFDSLRNLTADFTQLIAQKIERPGHGRARFCGEEIKRDLFMLDVHQRVVRRAVIAPVRGDGPGGFLADRPDTVDDLVDKAALVLDALSRDQRPQPAAMFKVNLFKMRAVARLGVFHKERGRQRLPGLFIQPFRAPHDGIDRLLRQLIPARLAVFRERMIVRPAEQHGFDMLRRFSDRHGNPLLFTRHDNRLFAACQYDFVNPCMGSLPKPRPPVIMRDGFNTQRNVHRKRSFCHADPRQIVL